MIAIVVVLFWFPYHSTYWQNEDYMAVHYTQSFGRALSDFAGGQYGVDTLVLFFRPLITLSFALDGLFGTAAMPFVSHLSNAVAHGLSAMCLALIVQRFSSSNHAWATGLVWGLAPCHASSVFWAVGRVDSHTTVWIVLSALFLVQWCAGDRPTRRLSLLCFVCALCSKELALVVPGIAGVLCFVMAEPGRRVRGVVVGVWPYVVVLALYLAWRFYLFGEVLGGYTGSSGIVGAALPGLGTRTAQLLNPLLHAGSAYAAEHYFTLPDTFYTIGFVPPVLAIGALFVQGRQAMLLALVVLFVGCSMPIVQLWADTTNPMNLRNFYLPMMPLAVLLSSWGWRTALPALAVAMLPFSELREDYTRSFQRCRSWHEQIQKEVPRHPHELNFIVGLPRVNEKATALEFHLAVDRLLAPPFGDGEKRVFALRPMSHLEGVHTIPYGEAVGLPIGATYAGGPDALRVVTNASPLQQMGWDRLGPTVLDLDVLNRMVDNFKIRAKGNPPKGQDPVIILDGVRARLYRVTAFTASGYVTAYVRDSAPADATNGHIELGLFLKASAVGPMSFPSGPGGGSFVTVGSLLQRATALDLSMWFPVLIEADARVEFDGNPEHFTPTHANFRPMWLSLDRRFADWWPE